MWPMPSGPPRPATPRASAGSYSRDASPRRFDSRTCRGRGGTASGSDVRLVEPGVEGHPLHQRQRAAMPAENGAPELVRILSEGIVGLRIDNEPRRLGELRLELARRPAAVAGEDPDALDRQVVRLCVRRHEAEA